MISVGFMEYTNATDVAGQQASKLTHTRVGKLSAPIAPHLSNKL